MKQSERTDKATQRMLPPLEHLTLDDWARICCKVEARYQGEKQNTMSVEEQVSS